MKKFMVFVLVVASFAAAYHYAPRFLSGKKSRIVRSEAKTIVDKQGNTKTLIPIAELPKAEARKNLDVLKGNVARMVANPGDVPERSIIVVYEGDKPIVMANVPHVHTLEYFYMGKTVAITGTWRKDVVVYGKPYRSFWIEDIKLLEK